jgi:DNA-binding LacI/PurR family transcriptional regulator
LTPDAKGLDVGVSLPRRVTIADVAALAGVSRGAVSMVFNGTGRISEPTAERIRLAAEQLHWHPSATAAALRRSRTQAVGMVIGRPGDAEPSFGSASLIAGIESVLAPLDYSLLLHLVDPEKESEERRIYEHLAHLGRVDGIIIGDSRVDDRRFDLARSLGLPAVLVGVPSGDDPIPHVENTLPGVGVDEAVDHLIQLGHRRIAYIGGPNDRVQALHRRDMFLTKLAESGLEPVAAISTRYSPNSAAHHTDQLLELAAPPTAILYGSDPMALGGIRAAHRRGVSVPEELSVVGFDDLQLSEWFSPPLTTVHRDVPQRGRAAATLLLRMLGQDLDPLDVGEPYLVTRDSTTSPP